jgi:hypothetical protein
MQWTSCTGNMGMVGLWILVFLIGFFTGIWIGLRAFDR